MTDDRQHFVDTHVHFWDHRRGDVIWPWLRPSRKHPVLGNIEAIKATSYTPTEFVAEVGSRRPTKVVHVEATMGTPDPVAETRWLDELAATTGLPDAIVARIDVRSRQMERVLESHLETSARVKGFRDATPGGSLSSRSLMTGLRAIERHGLLFEVAAHGDALGELVALAARLPGLSIVLQHAGRPAAHNEDQWRTRMGLVAASPSIFCKISGLGLGDRAWNPTAACDRIHRCIDLFGPSRCLLGSNWPVDRLFHSYDALGEVIDEAVGRYDPNEREAVRRTTAEALYSI